MTVPLNRSDHTPVLLAFPFRPFFLLTALYALGLLLAWMGLLFGGMTLPLGISPLAWHGHEMLFGMVPAAIAGFLLTAMCNWTGAPPLKGLGLLGLVLLWLAGRVAMWLSGWLPLWLVAVVDLAFLPVMGGYALTILLRHGNRRNFALVGMLAALTLANLCMHLSFLGIWSGGAAVGEVLALDLIAAIMIVIGGRITPAFTNNWLRMQNRPTVEGVPSPALDRAAMLSAVLMVPADLVLGAPWLGGLVALVAAAVNGWRLLRWQGWRTASEPLLWILHLGMAWIVLALVLKGLTPFLGLAPTVWYHAMGSGAIATLILGVMTRVAVGHTGRPMRLPRFAVWIYPTVLLAGVARLAAALGGLDYRLGLELATGAWTVAFALFLIIYWPILSRPRADGRPG